MAASSISGKSLAARRLASGGSSTTGNSYNVEVSVWKRPPQWLPLPNILPTEEKAAALCAIFPGMNYISVQAMGNYTVDWGDGSVENFNSDVQANHAYNFSNIPNSTLVNEDYKQVVITIIPQANNQLTKLNFSLRHPLFVTMGYYWVSNFLDIAISGSNLTTLIVAPDASGSYRHGILQQFNLIKSNIKSFAGLLSNCDTLKKVVNIDVPAMPNKYSRIVKLTGNSSTLTSNSPHGLNVGDIVVFPSSIKTNINYNSTIISSTVTYEVVQILSDLEFTIKPVGGSLFVAPVNADGFAAMSKPGNFHDFSRIFSSCIGLEVVPLFDTSAGINFEGMFSNCFALKVVPQYDTSSGINFNNMFFGCSSLNTVPEMNTSNGIHFGAMFNACSSLKTVPKMNTSNGIHFGGMFNECKLLETIPLFDTSKGVYLGSMFSYTRLLKTIPQINTSNGLYFDSMFANCNIEKLPQLNTAKMVSGRGMFTNSKKIIGKISLNLSSAPNSSSISPYSYGEDFISSQFIYEAQFHGLKFSWDPWGGGLPLQNFGISGSAFDKLFDSLGICTSNVSITLPSDYRVGTNVNLTLTTTAGSNVIPMTDTSLISVGLFVTGNNIPSSSSVSCTVSGNDNLISATAHSLANGEQIAMVSTSTVTGNIVLRKFYFVINATPNTFQISETENGPAFSLGVSTTMQFRIREIKVIAINPNVSVTISKPAISSGSTSVRFRSINVNIASVKGWSIQ